MSVNVVQTETLCAVCLEGEMTIASAAELKDIFMQSLSSGKELSISVAAVTWLDATALQLLYAVARGASEAGTRCWLDGEVPRKITDTLADAGFTRFPISTP